MNYEVFLFTLKLHCHEIKMNYKKQNYLTVQFFIYIYIFRILKNGGIKNQYCAKFIEC